MEVGHMDTVLLCVQAQAPLFSGCAGDQAVQIRRAVFERDDLSGLLCVTHELQRIADDLKVLRGQRLIHSEVIHDLGKQRRRGQSSRFRAQFLQFTDPARDTPESRIRAHFLILGSPQGCRMSGSLQGDHPSSRLVRENVFLGQGHELSGESSVKGKRIVRVRRGCKDPADLPERLILGERDISLHSRRDVPGTELRHDRPQVLLGARDDHEIAVTDRARLSVFFSPELIPPASRKLLDEVRDHHRVGLIRMIIGRLPHVGRIGINPLELVCRRRRERDRFKAALVLRLLRQQLPENAVVILREHSHGPEVPGQRQDRAAACLEQLLYFKKRRHIRAAEAVDRLLGITDDKERTLSRNAGAPLRNGVFR